LGLGGSAALTANWLIATSTRLHRTAIGFHTVVSRTAAVGSELALGVRMIFARKISIEARGSLAIVEVPVPLGSHARNDASKRTKAPIASEQASILAKAIKTKNWGSHWLPLSSLKRFVTGVVRSLIHAKAGYLKRSLTPSLPTPSMSCRPPFSSNGVTAGGLFGESPAPPAGIVKWSNGLLRRSALRSGGLPARAPALAVLGFGRLIRNERSCDRGEGGSTGSVSVRACRPSRTDSWSLSDLLCDHFISARPAMSATVIQLKQGRKQPRKVGKVMRFIGSGSI